MRISKFHHYDECVSCLSGRICDDSTASPNFMAQRKPALSERLIEWLYARWMRSTVRR